MSRQAKITDLNVKVINQNVMRFDIPMNYPVVMQVGKNWDKLLSDVLFLFLGKLNFLLM